MLAKFSPKAARLRSQLTYANVMSTVCAFLVLGGGAALAASLPKNSVKSKQIKNGAVKSIDVKDGNLTGTDIADNSITGADVNEATLNLPSLAPTGPAGGALSGTYPNPTIAANAVGGPEVDESTLGQVPDAANLQGRPLTQVRSTASNESDSNPNTLVAGTPEVVLSASLSGFGSGTDGLLVASLLVTGNAGNTVSCVVGTGLGVNFQPASSAALAEFTSNGQSIQLPVVGVATDVPSGLNIAVVRCSAVGGNATFESGDLGVVGIPG